MAKGLDASEQASSACGAGHFEAETRNGGEAAEKTMNLNFRFPPQGHA
jgi:hypothetical protein